ncbi:MAG: helix-turn-helix domain-containing protein [Burkholderiales bacterium]
MSTRMMCAVWIARLPTRLRQVALALADEADDDGRCQPSIAELARKTGLDKTAVDDAIFELWHAGALKRPARPRLARYTLDPADYSPSHLRLAPTRFPITEKATAGTKRRSRNRARHEKEKQSC